MKRFIEKFHREEEGVTAVEYAILLVAIALICIKTINLCGDQIQASFTASAANMDSAL